MTRQMTYTELRQGLKEACDTVCEEHEPLLISRRNGKDVVVLSKDDYDALEETAYLMRSPANARRLLKAMNADPAERVAFDDLESLKRALGV
ncbi:MAG: type II toxin-antitoxin system Phd/YefM family antitoxin [Minwuia sp.]|uniref:type II toxin-antitoxin system Phd/YefM family antitoxin n=1 Tax=Minwuia sp. TaxID=2493630 RepID=UPI003A8AF8FA